MGNRLEIKDFIILYLLLLPILGPKYILLTKVQSYFKVSSHLHGSFFPIKRNGGQFFI